MIFGGGLSFFRNFPCGGVHGFCPKVGTSGVIEHLVGCFVKSHNLNFNTYMVCTHCAPSNSM